MTVIRTFNCFSTSLQKNWKHYCETTSLVRNRHCLLFSDQRFNYAISGVPFFYVAQWRRRRRKCYRWLHQAQRSSKGNKRTVFTPSICLHYIGCLLWTLLHLIFSGFHAKGYWKAVLSARWESSLFVRRDSINVRILWRLDWWAKHTRYTWYLYLFIYFLVVRNKNRFLLSRCPCSWQTAVFTTRNLNSLPISVPPWNILYLYFLFQGHTSSNA